jgi:hypothetical protein
MSRFKTQPETYGEGGLQVFECVMSEDGSEKPQKTPKPKKPGRRRTGPAKRRRTKSK